MFGSEVLQLSVFRNYIILVTRGYTELFDRRTVYNTLDVPFRQIHLNRWRFPHRKVEREYNLNEAAYRHPREYKRRASRYAGTKSA